MPNANQHNPPHHNHSEIHFNSSDTVRDIVIGLSDGLTVPFALAAGIAGAVTNVASPTHLVVTAGLAEIAAGSIAMGLGGYLASRGDTEHYASERRREAMEVVDRPLDEEAEIYEIFENYGVDREAATPVLRSLQANPEAYVDFMMRFELGLEEPAPGRALRSAATIAFSYIAGGAVPLASYLIFSDINLALKVSVVVTLIALASFGGIKGKLLGAGVIRSAIQTVLIGGIAAAAAFALARLLNHA
ncbi:iron transporter [Granulicella sp. 5B5]|uniref:VIT1/CCC1 transporter family protein n=1 Tax=Granulicella sp. 5B5 TaxID=1617967 RepID=UPI0015F494AC|nr:VIT1/CCC1 transporter family protein [Granulicella sp. 5B5]QMV19282.1 iron transporter [Granulicella sp. 5B5]